MKLHQTTVQRTVGARNLPIGYFEIPNTNQELCFLTKKAGFVALETLKNEGYITQAEILPLTIEINQANLLETMGENDDRPFYRVKGVDYRFVGKNM